MSELGYAGQQSPWDVTDPYNATRAIFAALLARVSTATLVKVVAVTNEGDVSPVGFVDVQPLVNQLDGAGNAIPHQVVYHLPYFRLQGGVNAVILDPEVGDIGAAVFADRDISSVAATKAQANPGSWRRFDMADGMYFGGFLNGTPEQWVRFHKTEGIEVFSPIEIKMRAPKITFIATTEITATAPNIAQTASVAVTQTAPLIGLNGAITQTVATGGSTDVQLVGPVNVQQQIHSDTDVTAQTVSLHGHTHYENGEGEQTNPPTT